MPDKHQHCANCGSKLEGEQKAMAANPTVQFCCQCGLQLDKDGCCQNEDDFENFRKKPKCD